MKITVIGMMASILCILVLIFLAYKWPDLSDNMKIIKAASQWKIIFIGLLLMVGLIVGMWILSSLSIPWIITFIFLSGLPWVGIRWFQKLGASQWKEKQQWAGVMGLLIPWLFMDVISELDNSIHPDDTSGMILAALIFLVLGIKSLD